jgi:hypothetical protein
MNCPICNKPLEEHTFTDFTEHILGFDHPDFYKEWAKLLSSGKKIEIMVDMGPLDNESES